MQSTPIWLGAICLLCTAVAGSLIASHPRLKSVDSHRTLKLDVKNTTGEERNMTKHERLKKELRDRLAHIENKEKNMTKGELKAERMRKDLEDMRSHVRDLATDLGLTKEQIEAFYAGCEDACGCPACRYQTCVSDCEG